MTIFHSDTFALLTTVFLYANNKDYNNDEANKKHFCLTNFNLKKHLHGVNSLIKFCLQRMIQKATYYDNYLFSHI